MERAAATERFADFLVRYRAPIFGFWFLHAFLLHWLYLGSISWDGFTYRIPPIVELVQHGGYHLEKYNQWAFAGYVPVPELVHAPFLYAFKAPGVLVGYGLLVFPLCAMAVFALLRELTGDARAGAFGALAYVAIPMVNEQAFSGYIDFLVIGVLAFFVYAIVRLRNRTSSRRAFGLVFLATFLFTMVRAQGVYVSIILVPVLTYALFVRRKRFRLEIVDRKAIAILAAGWLLASVPAVAIQVHKYRLYGTPIYPFQFKLLGVTIGHGISQEWLYWFGDLKDFSLGSFARSSMRSWIWPQQLGGFFDSRDLGGGWVLPLALVLVPVFYRARNRLAAWLVVSCLGMSFIAKDFWLPRYAYTLNLALIVVIGSGLAALTRSRQGRWLFWFGSILLVAHLGRPEYDLVVLSRGVGPRLNITNSGAFVWGPGAIEMFPDQSARLVIVDQNQHGFLLPLYGRNLTNDVVGTVKKEALGESCSGLTATLADTPNALFVDDNDYTKACARECAIRTPHHGECRAFRIRPGVPAQDEPKP